VESSPPENSTRAEVVMVGCLARGPKRRKAHYHFP